MKRSRKTSPRAIAAIALFLVAAVAVPKESGPAFTRQVVDISVPNLTLIDQDGNEVQLQDILRSDKPVLVDFIFATCTTICPILSAGFSSVQRKLGDSRSKVRLISITIDPEHDGPEQMREYLERYHAKPGWDFLTGTRTDIDRVMKSFGAFVADKMSHRPLVFIRAPGAESTWVRLDGFAGSADLLEEIEKADHGS